MLCLPFLQAASPSALGWIHPCLALLTIQEYLRLDQAIFYASLFVKFDYGIIAFGSVMPIQKLIRFLIKFIKPLRLKHSVCIFAISMCLKRELFSHFYLKLPSDILRRIVKTVIFKKETVPWFKVFDNSSSNYDNMTSYE